MNSFCYLRKLINSQIVVFLEGRFLLTSFIAFYCCENKAENSPYVKLIHCWNLDADVYSVKKLFKYKEMNTFLF